MDHVWTFVIGLDGERVRVCKGCDVDFKVLVDVALAAGKIPECPGTPLPQGIDLGRVFHLV